MRKRLSDGPTIMSYYHYIAETAAPRRIVEAREAVSAAAGGIHAVNTSGVYISSIKSAIVSVFNGNT